MTTKPDAPAAPRGLRTVSKGDWGYNCHVNGKSIGQTNDPLGFLDGREVELKTSSIGADLGRQFAKGDFCWPRGMSPKSGE